MLIGAGRFVAGRFGPGGWDRRFAPGDAKEAAMAGSRPGPAPRASAVLSRRRLFGYAAGSTGTGVFSTVPGLLLLFYLTDVLGVAAAIAGAVVVVPKVWDVFFNPFVGAASDRQAIRTGTRTRLMLVGALTLPVAFALIFAGVGTGSAAALWVTLTFLAAATFYALFQVPYVALPAEMSENPRERSRVMGWRIIALTLGILVGGAVAPIVVDVAGGGVDGYRVMGVVVAAIMMTAMLIAALSTRWVHSRPGAEPLGFAAAFKVARGNEAFTALLTSFVLQALGIAVALASVAYVCTYFLGNYGLTSVLFAAIVAPSAFVVPLWVKLGNRWGKTRALIANVAGFVVVFVLFTITVWLESTPLAVGAALLVGVFYGGSQVLPYSMLTDAIIVDEARTGQRQSGAFTGVWTASETGAFALGPGIFAAFLAITGFMSSTFDEPVTQSASAMAGILIGAGIAPAVLFCVSLPFIVRFGRTPAARV